ncbi:MAG: FAD-dependent oxidoreductase [Gemmatimonadaceae bacterium]
MGGGHAHLEVLRHCVVNGIPPGAEVVLVSPVPHHVYTGMVPGYLHGAYDVGCIAFDLPTICRAGGVRYVEAMAERVSGTERVVNVGRTSIEFDSASLDVGSVPSGGMDSAVLDHASVVRPLPQLLALRARLDDLARASSDSIPVVTVVGAGAAGVEVALAIRAMLSAARVTAMVAITDESSDVLPGYPRSARRRARSILEAHGLHVAMSERVTSVGARTISLADGTRVESDVTVWLAGAAPPPVLAASDLPLDGDGFFRVDRHLRSVDGAPVWGAGDCVTMVDAPGTPKAGVYAVREGPVLAQNLWASLGAGIATAYTPQPDFLVVLDTADGKALLRWRGLVSHSRWALWLKRRIDRRFMNRYTTLTDEVKQQQR